MVGFLERADAVVEGHVDAACGVLCAGRVVFADKGDRCRAFARGFDLPGKIVRGRQVLDAQERVLRVLDVPVVERHRLEVHVVLVGGQARGHLHAAAACAANALDADAAVAVLHDVDAAVELVDLFAVGERDDVAERFDVEDDVAVFVGGARQRFLAVRILRERDFRAWQRHVLVACHVHGGNADLLVGDDEDFELGVGGIRGVGEVVAVLPERFEQKRRGAGEAAQKERSARKGDRLTVVEGFGG